MLTLNARSVVSEELDRRNPIVRINRSDTGVVRNRYRAVKPTLIAISRRIGTGFFEAWSRMYARRPLLSR